MSLLTVLERQINDFSNLLNRLNTSHVNHHHIDIDKCVRTARCIEHLANAYAAIYSTSLFDFDNLPPNNVIPFPPQDFLNDPSFFPSSKPPASSPKPKRRRKPGQPSVSRKPKDVLPPEVVQPQPQPQPQRQLKAKPPQSPQPPQTPQPYSNEPIISGYSWGDGFYGKEYYGLEDEEIVNNPDIALNRSGLVDFSELDNPPTSFDAGATLLHNPMDGELIQDHYDNGDYDDYDNIPLSDYWNE